MAVKNRWYIALSSIVMFILLVSSILFFNYESYLLLSFSIIAITMLPFFIRFEVKKISSREIVILAILASIAAVSRVPFAPLPSVQPTSFVIMIAGLVFGAESGFIVGAVAAIVSNIFLGQGPWTPWQMYAWGMLGMTAGLFRNRWWMKQMWGKLIFGFIWGYVFGWFMNFWIIVSSIENFTWEFFISIYVASIYFDLAHGLSNVFFIVIFSASWIRILTRFKRKYGLLDELSL
ncbi:MAG TPA: ECF transporter S component [Candidatus Pseudogracilibacillus intestinigallinarum]|uniref:ECF transporter S component n=1 Tax=Candidatus Pseudogracilibacillus intestinigallinarum TaxID=2838742 RepID=A0A9D1PMN5_9BACI|nr:ECF transporter S component [Candidatus Pseudogracilibacillus intestinigallinarum]